MGGGLLLLSKISFYGTTLILIILILVLCFKFNKKTEEKITEEVSNEYIASYFDGEYQNEIPGKDDGYVVDKIVCDNGAIGTWNYDNWGINIKNPTKKIKCSIYFNFITKYDFDYTDNEQIFIVPKDGIYRLETWGSSGYLVGLFSESSGGVGGYSRGEIKLQKGQKLYVNVGGPGNDGVCTKNYCQGGYNGGGRGAGSSSPLVYSGSGGGATHIATKTGLLSELHDSLSDILIVAGGGGANSYQKVNGQEYSGTAGSGGGFRGTDGTTTQSDFKNGSGGNQTSGGASSSATYKNVLRGDAGTFGQGGNGNFYSAGGGGGFYGGGASNQSGSGGGSGYIGNSLLTNKVMYCYNCEESSVETIKTISTSCIELNATENCSKSGNGYARITFIK